MHYYTARTQHGIELTVVFRHPELDGPGETPDEAFSKTMRRMWVQFAKCRDPSLTTDISPVGYAIEWPAYNVEEKPVMVLDEFDIHVEPESELRLIDWGRCDSLTKYHLYL